MATKDFDAMLVETAGTRPTFKVGGQQFTIRKKLPYKKFLRLMAAMGEEDAETGEAEDLFFKAVLIPEDRDRFLELLNNEGDDDEDAVIDPVQLRAITEWLMGVYTGKAPTSSDSSSNGPSTTGGQRKVVSLTPRAS